MIYIPTLEEILIFDPTVEQHEGYVKCGGVDGLPEDIFLIDCHERNKVSQSLRMAACLADIDPGFVGECDRKYVLSNNGVLDTILVFTDRNGSWVATDGWLARCKSEGEAKGLLFRLVLCWMREQEDKRIACLENGGM